MSDGVRSLLSTCRRGPIPYLIAVLFVALAVLARSAIAPLDEGLHFLTFFPAVTLSALIGGFWPGMFATLLGMIAATYGFFPPFWAFPEEPYPELVWSNLIFFGEGLIVCTAVAALDRYHAERTRALEALEISEESHALALDVAELGTWRHDVAAGTIRFDARARNHYGLDKEVLTLEEGLAILHPDDRDRLAAALSEGIAATDEITRRAVEYRVILPDGSTRWLAVQVRVHFAGTGNGRHPVFAYGTSQDISERKRTDDRSRANEERLILALEGAEQGVWDWNVADGTVFFSKVWSTMLGYAEGELAGRFDDWASRVHPDDLVRCRKELDSHFAGETPSYRCEHRVRCKDGSYKWILAQGQVFTRTPGGKPLRMLGTHTDITERMESERRLRESRAQLQAVFDNLEEGIVIADLQGNLLHWNRAALRIHGFADEAEGRQALASFTDRFRFATPTGEPVPFDRWPMGRVLAGETFRDLDLVLHRLDANWQKAFRYAGTLIRDSSGTPFLALLNLTDITDRRRDEAWMRFARQTIELSADGVFWNRRDASIAYVNDAACRMLGYAREELTRLRIPDLNPTIRPKPGTTTGRP